MISTLASSSIQHGLSKARACALSLQFFAVSSLVLGSAEAFAQAAGAVPAAGAGGQSPLMGMLPIFVMIAIVYFLMLRPQMNKQKQHQEFVTKLKRGDEVLTTGGILGRIEGLTDMYITLEIAPDVRIRILRSQIASNLPTVTAGTEVKA